MTAAGTDTITADIFKVTWKPVTSNRFDTAGFKKTHADLYGQYLKPSITRRFSISA
jgi:predicted phage-related endonuclease